MQNNREEYKDVIIDPIQNNKKELKDVIINILENYLIQESLGKEFQKILFENIWDLYQS